MSRTTVFFAACYVIVEPGSVKRLVAYFWEYPDLLLGDRHLRDEIREAALGGGIPSFLKIEDEQVLRVLADLSRAASDIYRVQSKFGISLALGEFHGLVLPFILHMMATTTRVWVRLLGLATIPVVLVVTLRTNFRLAFISFFASLLGYGVFWSSQFWRKNRESIWVPTMTLAYMSGLAAFVALSFAWRRLERLVWGGGAQRSSTDSCKEQYAWAGAF